MRFKVFAVSVVLLVAFSAVNLAAQGHAPFRVQIPIDFVVNDKEYPAGEYTVSQYNTDWETLDGPGGRIMAFALRTLRGEAGSNNLLIFHQVGDKYYFSELWTAGESTGRAINMGTLSKKRRDTMVARAVTVVSGGGTKLLSK